MALQSNLFRGVRRLEQCATDHAHNVKTGDKGDYVKLIQQALQHLDAADIVDDGAYGNLTAGAVLDFKTTHRILGAGQTKPDSVVGKLTIARLDELQLEFEKHAQPLPPPVPRSALANVSVANMGPRTAIILLYYKECGLETIGVNQRVSTSLATLCETMEDIIDNMIAQPHREHVIVCHGNPKSGLTIKICRETNFFESSPVMNHLGAVADELALSSSVPPGSDAETSLKKLVGMMRVKDDVVLRLAGKLVKLRKKKINVHLRACNITNPNVADNYKLAFGAQRLTYHGCRLFFLPMGAEQVKKPLNLLKIKLVDTARQRTRISVDVNRPRQKEPIGLTIIDIDGHTRVQPFFRMQKKDPAELDKWLAHLLDKWSTPNPSTFVLPVMWENSERTFHYPCEQGWMRKLNVR